VTAPAPIKRLSNWNKTSALRFTLVGVGRNRDKAQEFEQLAMPLFGPLYNLASWLTQNRSDAEDLVQETYAKALKGFDSFQPGTNFRAWIYRILRNTFLTSRTGLKTAVSLDDEEDPETITPATTDTPESILLARADQDAIEHALRQLPVAHREIILLCDVEEMSYREIAAALDVPLGTVMSRLARARKSMRQLLQHRATGADQ
jgi:RNA polymerase sigma-70 factor, ECF subfamily